MQGNKARTGDESEFKNARYWFKFEHWNWTVHPNARESASFLEENIMPIQESGQLHFVEREENQGSTFIDELGFGVLFIDGHTEKQMLPHIQYQNKILVFAADLIPTAGHIPLPYVMGYDTRPLLSLKENEAFLYEAVKHNIYLFFDHYVYYLIVIEYTTESRIR